MRIAKSFVIFAACTALLASCKRPQPSPQYSQARDKWTELLRARSGDEDAAAADPGADEVIALLAQVDATSSDTGYAAELKAKIETARAAVKSREQASAKMVAQAGTTPAFVGSSVPYVPRSPPVAAPVAAVADQKPPEAKEPKVGMSEADFTSKFSRCFDAGDEIPYPEGPGHVHTLKDLSLCRELYPTFQSNSVLTLGGKVHNIGPTAQMKPQRYKIVNGQQIPYDEEAEKAAAAKAAKEAKAAAEKAAAAKAAAEPAPY